MDAREEINGIRSTYGQVLCLGRFRCVIIARVNFVVVRSFFFLIVLLKRIGINVLLLRRGNRSAGITITEFWNLHGLFVECFTCFLFFFYNGLTCRRFLLHDGNVRSTSSRIQCELVLEEIR